MLQGFAGTKQIAVNSMNQIHFGFSLTLNIDENKLAFDKYLKGSEDVSSQLFMGMDFHISFNTSAFNPSISNSELKRKIVLLSERYIGPKGQKHCSDI